MKIGKVKPYLQLMRLDKPIGSLLLLWPTLWALWIAAQGKPSTTILIIFIVGVVLMRSAGCVINDIADRDFDGKVARTCNRPLVIGSVKLKQAIALFIGLCILGFLLVLQLNLFTLLLSFIAVALAMLYPFAKRMTYLPQLVLGAAFAWSVPMAFAAVNNYIPTLAWGWYVIAVIWPFAYDSIYALMDREDDVRIGVKSTAILFGHWDIATIGILQSLVILGLLILGWQLEFNIFYYLAILIAAVMILYQIALLRGRSNERYYQAFYNNHWVGFTVFVGILLNYL